MGDAELCQVGNDRGGIVEVEAGVQLQSIGGDGNGVEEGDVTSGVARTPAGAR